MDPTIEEQLAALRKEVEALRAGKAEPPKDEEPSLKDQIGDLNAALRGYIDDVESGATRHPLAAVAAAFAIGLLVGRIIA